MSAKLNDFISTALREPVAALGYHVSRWLSTLHPALFVLESEDASFDLHGFAHAGHATAASRAAIHAQLTTSWGGPTRPPAHDVENGWFDVTWGDQEVQVVLMTFPDGGGCSSRHAWVLARDRALAESFFQAVCLFSTEIKGEILVYESGHWQRSPELYAAIRSASLDDLVLRGSLAGELVADLRRFFESREIYERYGVPYKRGVLFTGPPGNGKTHAVKALVRELDRPCLYVKSLKARYATDHDGVRRIFERARRTAPCVVVLEDLDALVDGKNRSMFLNELDGFADNTGVLTLATTNHPERLDPALVERPSRFDRKVTFDLPALEERRRYLERWDARLSAELRLSGRGLVELAEATAGFSFAFLKELCLSSTMRWIDRAAPGSMDTIAAAEARSLREQMSRPVVEAPPAGQEDDEDDDED